MLKIDHGGDDVYRIQRVAAERCNILMTLEEAYVFWEELSEKKAARWLHLSEHDEVVAQEIILRWEDISWREKILAGGDSNDE